MPHTMCLARKTSTLRGGEIPMAPVPRQLRPGALQSSPDECAILCSFNFARENIKTQRANKRRLNFEIEDFGNFGMQPVAEWNRLFNREPTLSCVLGLKQLQIINGLTKLTRIIENLPVGQHISQQTGKWIYTFLVCIYEPLLADNVSLLRHLARLCAVKMSQINVQDANAITIAAPYNLFITIVTMHFKQYDLKY